MKYLLQAIEARREAVQLSDGELRKLLVEVRSGKDDRIEFFEAMTRLLEELRSSEHATAFLTKVAKRDAPDYYEVIKNPMDLGTMLRNVKNGRYKSKAQFMRDLDLIWDNCLTYNSEPTHPLRRSVQLLRAKANHLLTYVNDSNDVKEALSQWQSSSTATHTRSSGAFHSSSPWDENSSHINGNGKGNSQLNGRSMSMSLQKVHAALFDTPFEQKPAVVRSVQGMSTFASLDHSISQADEHFGKVYLSLDDSSAEAGPSRRPIVSFDSETSRLNGQAAIASGDMLRTLESSNQRGVLRSALTMGTADIEIAGSNGISADGSFNRQGKQRESETIPYPLELQDSSDGVLGDDFQLGAWWNSTSSSALLASGMSPTLRSIQVDAMSRQLIGQSSRKRRRRRRNELPSHVFGGIEALERNVSTISKLRRTHAKFGALANHIENEEPIPAGLAVVSSDESDSEATSTRGTQGQHELRSKRRYKEADMPSPSLNDLQWNPFAKLSSEGATDILESKMQFLLAHAGFEGVQRAAADVLTDVASEYMMNIGRTLRMYTDQYAHEMSVEEIILHTLFENGRMDIRSLESYIVDDVVRYGGKMSDLLRKLQASYRDTLSTTNLTMEDEAYFAENAEGNNDQIMSGTFAQEMGDDFFGFKEMGLDKELGLDMSKLVIPSKLFNRGSNTRSIGRAGIGHAAVGTARGGSAANGAGPVEVLLFDPPPPYVLLTESAISAQIALLQPFYRDLIRSRGQWQQDGRNEDDDDEGEDDEEREERRAAAAIGSVEEDDTRRSILVLPEEEMERQRYKVPPNGKMPKRAMKSKRDGSSIIGNGRNRDAAAASTTTTAATSNVAGTAKSKESVKSSNSSKKKKKDV